MPLDQLGNPLLAGDAVAVKVGDQMLIAQVEDIKEPSVLAPGQNQMQVPGQLQLRIPFTVLFDIKNKICGNVVKLVKPPNFGKKPD